MRQPENAFTFVDNGFTKGSLKRGNPVFRLLNIVRNRKTHSCGRGLPNGLIFDLSCTKRAHNFVAVVCTSKHAAQFISIWTVEMTCHKDITFAIKLWTVVNFCSAE